MSTEHRAPRTEHREAEAVLVEALARRRRVLGPDHPHVAESQMNLAVVFEKRRAFDRAAAQFEEAIRVLEKAFPKPHPLRANTEFAFGRMRFREQRFTAALPHFEQAVTMRVATMGEGNVRTADARLWLGRCLLALGRPEEAVTALESAHAALRAAQGPDSPAVREAAEALAQARR